MSAAREIVSLATAPIAPSPPAAGGVRPPSLAGRAAARLQGDWLPRAAWTLGRTGRPGLVGVALLLGAAVFLFSTHLQVAAEVAALRADLAAAQPARPRATAPEVARPAQARRTLPARADVAGMLRQLFAEAAQAHLAVDTGRYEVKATRSSGLVRYQIAFPVSGPYPRIRGFIDATLASMPMVAVSDLVLERKSIGDARVEAQLGMTVYTAERGVPGARAAPTVGPTPDRVVAPTQEAALFAQRSWYVPPPPRPRAPPPPPPPPPEPTAPALPYALLGRFAPGADPPVFFLARGERVIEARVGDTIDGVYQLESATASQLVFVYLPLNVRQLLLAGGSK